MSSMPHPPEKGQIGRHAQNNSFSDIAVIEALPTERRGVNAGYPRRHRLSSNEDSRTGVTRVSTMQQGTKPA